MAWYHRLQFDRSRGAERPRAEWIEIPVIPLVSEDTFALVSRSSRGVMKWAKADMLTKRLATAVGLDPARYSGHSLRAGFTSIMKQTRHKSVDVAKNYVRDADLWRDNVSGLVL